MAICEAMGPCSDGLRVHLLIDHYRLALRVIHRRALVIHLCHLDGVRIHQSSPQSYGLKFWGVPCQMKKSAATEADRQREIVSDARDIHPEVAQVRGLAPRDAADQRRRDRQADRQEKNFG